MPNIFSNVGYAMEGVDAAQQARDQAALRRNQIRLGEQNIGLGEQDVIQKRQATDLGAMGLEEAQFGQGVKRATRAAGAAATAAGKPLTGSLLDMSDAAAAQGDVATAAQYRQAFSTLKNMGVTEVINAAMTNPTPGKRQDILDILHRNEGTQGATDVELDDKGNLTITKSDGSKGVTNIGVMAERMGLVKPRTIHNVPAGGLGVEIGVGGPTGKTFSTPKTFAEPALNTKVEKVQVKDADGNERTYLWNLERRDWEGDRPPAGTAAPGSVRRDLPVIKEIGDAVLQREGLFKMQQDPNNPLAMLKVLTPKGEQVAVVASQLWQSNKNMDPNTVVEMATKGKPMWKTENGNRTGVVIYNGQEFPMSTPTARGGRPSPTQQPNLPTNPAGEITAIPANEVDAARAAGIKVNYSVPVAPARPAVKPAASSQQKVGGRTFETGLEANDPELKSLGDRVRLGVKDPSIDFKLWQAYVARAKQLGSTNYAKGGKVIRYGL